MYKIIVSLMLLIKAILKILPYRSRIMVPMPDVKRAEPNQNFA